MRKMAYCLEAKAESDLNGLEALLKQRSGGETTPAAHVPKSTLLMHEHKNNLAEIEKPSTSYMLPPINAHNEMYTTLAQNLP